MKTIKPFNDTGIRRRIIVFSLLFSLLFLIIAVKSIHLQVFRKTWLSEKAANQYEKLYKSSGKRGIIFDKQLREMAVSVDVKSVAAHPKQVKAGKRTATSLSKVLGLDYKSLYGKLCSDRQFVWIKRHISPKEELEIKKLDFDGIVFKSEFSRFYPNKTLAAQVLGFTGIDGNGLEGLEFSYDSYLKGDVSQEVVLKDALGRRFDADQNIESNLNGNNIVLTIDSTIQYIAEKALEESVTEFSGKSGMALVMDPRTGALLAIAHFPFFNPNSFKEYNDETWRNRAVTDSFEPGSTIKIFNAATAMDSGLCTPDTIFFCENGEYKIGQNIVHDAGDHAYGWLSLQQIIKYSSNIGAVKVEELIGSERLYKGLCSFGFGEKTRIDSIGENSGSLSNYKRWSRIDAGAISFGQGVSVSAMQLITAMSAIANKGVLMKPFLIQSIIDVNGNLIKEVAPQPVRRVVSEETAEATKHILKTVMTGDGTGKNAALSGYTVCGKTGTAQKIGMDGSYEPGKYVASFLGFVPADNPILTILVVVDEPQSQYYGGTVAAPVFRKIAHEVLDYLNVPPASNGKDIFTVAWDNGVRG